MKSTAPKSQLRRILGVGREYLTSWVIAGAIITLTGFSPDLWIAAIIDYLAIRENLSLVWLPSVDIRIGLVAIGIAIIAWNILRRNNSRHEALFNGPVDIPTPVPPPNLSISSRRQPQAIETATSDKPSIAVLPFRNLSGDPEQEYFSDGISDDIITELSRNPWLVVLSRNSGFAFKGTAVDVKRIGLELGVRYVVDGSVRRSADRVRVVAQLVEAETGRHVWAERYDRPIGKLFDLQDEITQAVVGTLVPALGTVESERALRKPPQSLGAWEAYQRGLWHYHRPYNVDDQAAARKLFEQAIELDPGFADAHAMLALFDYYAVLLGGAASPDETLATAQRAAEKAVELENSNALAHVALARVRSVLRNHESAIAEAETAIALNPNLAVAHYALALACAYAGNGKQAIASFDRAIQLSPNDPSRWSFFHLKSRTLIELQEYEQALAAAKSAQRLRPSAFLTYTHSAAALVGLGRLGEACEAIGEARSRNPALTMAFFTNGPARYDVFAFPHYIELLRKAGLPD